MVVCVINYNNSVCIILLPVLSIRISLDPCSLGHAVLSTPCGSAQLLELHHVIQASTEHVHKVLLPHKGKRTQAELEL